MIAICIFMFSFSVKGNTVDYTLSDTVYHKSKPKIWRPALEVFSTNMLVWGFNKAINKDCANINWNTIKYNFRKGPTWDTDQFTTNLFAHPYHGSLYFNAAREEGYNFWQSIPFVVGGSFMWEFFMENEPPSINDMMATTFGGIGLGEVTYRLTELLVDNSSGGIERVGRELAIGLLSPVKAVNRLISGRTWRRSSADRRIGSNIPLRLSCQIGARVMKNRDVGPLQGAMNINLSLMYGDKFKEKSNIPYDWFKLNTSFSAFSSQPFVNEVNIIGSLWRKEVLETQMSDMSFGLFQHFDFYDSGLYSKEVSDDNSPIDPKNGYPSKRLEVPPYRIGAPVALGAGLLYQKRNFLSDNITFDGELYTNAIILGASLSDYMYFEQRDYNLGSGYGIKGLFKLDYNNKVSLSCSTDNFHIYTWKGYDPAYDWSDFNPDDPSSLNVQGDKSNALLRVFAIDLKYNITNNLHLSLTNRYFYRRTFYTYRPELISKTTDYMINIGYTL